MSAVAMVAQIQFDEASILRCACLRIRYRVYCRAYTVLPQMRVMLPVTLVTLVHASSDPQV